MGAGDTVVAGGGSTGVAGGQGGADLDVGGGVHAGGDRPHLAGTQEVDGTRVGIDHMEHLNRALGASRHHANSHPPM